MPKVKLFSPIYETSLSLSFNFRVHEINIFGFVFINNDFYCWISVNDDGSMRIDDVDYCNSEAIKFKETEKELLFSEVEPIWKLISPNSVSYEIISKLKEEIFPLIFPPIFIKDPQLFIKKYIIPSK